MFTLQIREKDKSYQINTLVTKKSADDKFSFENDYLRLFCNFLKK
jgi:hypothetical protein